MRAALLIVVALAAPALADPLPSPVIFPVQKLPLSFSHQQHLALPGVGCGTCHEDAARSRRAADRNIPPESACVACHAIERDKPDKEVAAGEPDAKCSSCHPGFAGAGFPPRVIVPTPNLKFNHEVHASRGIACATCHAVAQVNLATRAQLPRMPSCLGCHDNRQAPAGCATCHVVEGPARLRTEFPEGRLVPSGTLRGDAHDLRFRVDHAAVAANDEKYCTNCHARSYCVDCHNGVAKPLDFHGNDYVSIHPIEARRGTPDCQSCHRQQTFCTGCHSRLGVSDDPKTTGYQTRLPPPEEPLTRLFHPPGWIPSGGSLPGANDHSFQAMRNIRACASCHREDFCLSCHQNRGTDPHPPGWARSARCKALLARNGRMCLRCHFATVEEARCD